MFRALQYIILLVTICMTGFYINVYQPELVTKLLVNCDIFGFSAVAKSEHDRIEKIRALEIPYEEKQVLMNRTVFMQASPDMVELALGTPKPENKRAVLQQGHDWLYYIYYLGEDKRPTILIFMDKKLVEAHKGSAADLAATK